MNSIDTLRALVTAHLLFAPTIALGESSHGNHPPALHKHEILIQNETAYLQGRGRTQIDFGYEIFRNKEIHHETIDEDVSLFALEYGLSERFQLSLETIHISETEVDNHDHLHKASGFGDIEVAVSSLIAAETAYSPQMVVAFRGILPTGDEDEGLGFGEFGWGLGLNASKMVDDRTGIHFSAKFDKVDGAKIKGSQMDIEELSLGFSASYAMNDKTILLFEYKSNREKETDSRSHTETITQRYLAPGVLIKLPHHRELGISIPIGLNDESFAWGAILEYTIEL